MRANQMDSTAVEMDERRTILDQPTNPTPASRQSIIEQSRTTDAEKAEFRHLLRANFYETVVYCTVFSTFGMSIAFLGPTLWDLGCQTATTMPHMMRVFFAQSLFILIGSMAAGKVLSCVDANKVNLSCVIVVATTFCLLTTCTSMLSLFCVLAIMGFHLGILDTTTNVSMINLYGDHAAPFLQVLHFCYGLGAFLSPITVRPFLQNFDCSQMLDNSSSTMTIMQQEFIRSHADEEMSQPKTLDDARQLLHVHLAFEVMALLQVPVIILLCCTLHAASTDKTQNNNNNIIKKNASDVQITAATSHGRRHLAYKLTLCGLLLFAADGLQALFGSFIFSYGRLAIRGLSTEHAVMLNALFWGSFAIGRVLAIFAAVYVVPAFLLLIDLIGITSATLMLTCMAGNRFTVFLGTGLFGLAVSNVCPTTIGLLTKTTTVSPSAISAMVVAAALGEMLYPLVAGSLIEWHGSSGFLLLCNLSSAVMLVLFALLQPYCAVSKKGV